jgi:hypothetical protein
MPSIGWDRREYDHQRYIYARTLVQTWLGSKCVWCGEKDPDKLEFDHIDRETKLWNIANLWNDPRKLEIELKKVRLLCYDCHKKNTREQFSVEHGGGVSGKKNCKCEPCRKKKNEWQNERRRAKRAQARAEAAAAATAVTAATSSPDE